MSLLINACHILTLSVQQFPDVVLQEIYREKYHCAIQHYQGNVDPAFLNTPTQLDQLFHTHSKWWAVYTLDSIASDSFNSMIQQGVKPGVILPAKILNWREYQLAKSAVKRGAIPIMEYHVESPNDFASKAIVATALGFRPMAAYVVKGWDVNVIAQPKGTYLVQYNGENLALPADKIVYQKHTFYRVQALNDMQNGMQILLNPEHTLPIEQMIYPDLGISWQFYGNKFTSYNQGIQTSLIGYILIISSLLSIPVNIILNTIYPEILSSLGTIISWVSLLLGSILFIILVVSIVKRVKKNETN